MKKVDNFFPYKSLFIHLLKSEFYGDSNGGLVYFLCSSFNISEKSVFYHKMSFYIILDKISRRNDKLRFFGISVSD